MTHIRVNPESVRSYGRQAQDIFESMHTSLVTLTNDVVGVQYFGPNAVAFKTECGRLAAEFASRLHLDMGAMAEAVRRSTSNIAASLGGEPIIIQLDPRPIQPPTPETVDYVDVDTAALEGLNPMIGQRFTALREGLDRNVQQLQATDWEGNAKLAAVDAIQQFTNSARLKCDTAQEALTRFVTDQVNSVTMADA